jgi:hypothetical protein
LDIIKYSYSLYYIIYTIVNSIYIIYIYYSIGHGAGEESTKKLNTVEFFILNSVPSNVAILDIEERGGIGRSGHHGQIGRFGLYCHLLIPKTIYNS